MKKSGEKLEEYKLCQWVSVVIVCYLTVTCTLFNFKFWDDHMKLKLLLASAVA